MTAAASESGRRAWSAPRLAVALAAAALASLLLASPAAAEFGFLHKWGSPGFGDGQFGRPTDVATAPSGSVYVADSERNRIQKFSAAGVFQAKWGGFGDDDEGRFDNPDGVGVGADGFVYVADRGNARIQKFDSNGGFVRMWGRGVRTGGDTWEVCFVNCQNGIAGDGDGEFRFPSDVAADSDGFVYVTDSGNNRIQKFNSSGSFIREWSIRDDPSDPFENTLATGVATDASGNVYVSEQFWKDRIQKFNSIGGARTVWGSFGSQNGQFRLPDGVAADSAGNVYVADTGNDRIQRFNSSGTFLSKWGSEGAGDNQFSSPIGVATGSGGDVYVADSTLSRIQLFGQLPNATITAGPPASTRERTATFRFTGSRAVRFQCRLDGSAFQTCTSPRTLSGLQHGNHQFQVRAIDRFGNPDPSPASFGWRIEPPPDTTITESTIKQVKRRATFTFTSDVPGSTFECSLDGADFAACTSPRTLSGLEPGKHNLRVRAIDSVGNLDPSAARSDWQIRRWKRVRFKRVEGFKSAGGNRIRVKRLVMRRIKPGRAKIVVSCKGGRKRGCTFKQKRVKVKGKGKSRKANLTRLFRKRALRPKARIIVRGKVRRRVDKVVIYRVKRGPDVDPSERCIAPFTKKMRSCSKVR